METLTQFSFEAFKAYGLTALVAYLLGSISFAVIFTWLFTKKDVRKFGSGNAGTTNVLRVAGFWAGLLTFICDFAKGAMAIVCGRAIFQAFCESGIPDAAAASQLGACVAGLFAVLGHLYPLYFGFRGGKGVMTVAGIILMTSPMCFLIIVLIFAATLIITKTVSISSCVVSAAYPVITFAISYYQHASNPGMYSVRYMVIQTVIALILGTIIIVMHRSNIKRIIAGTEPKFSIKKKGDDGN